ncbi:MAG: glycoside hydrolase family 99-like domain-containing protein [Candidatus Riflebacteria bacterium]|nr:glycoside hydrolase family 99-like domain-containing protein [Candidatus Riflebacteria bacterium]
MKTPDIAAYYYPGWHYCQVRNASFPKDWTEWELVYNAIPRFEGHEQPNIPVWGKYNESDPAVFDQKVKSARDYGVDVFVFAHYWSRGKILLESALKEGFLKSSSADDFKFAVFWANRMPRKVLPVKDTKASVIDTSRLVYTDPDDFLKYIVYLAENFFFRKNYYRINEKPYLSIFDTSFFLTQLGVDRAASTISEAKKYLESRGLGGMHLCAIDPVAKYTPLLKEIGFESITHYVNLPDWKGDYQQDFVASARNKSEKWGELSSLSGLPYTPSVSPGWDATPRSSEFGKEKSRKYPWWPIVTGRSPDHFKSVVKEALEFNFSHCATSLPVFIASWNEWSEGHYLEPDEKYGFAWLDAVRQAKVNFQKK